MNQSTRSLRDLLLVPGTHSHSMSVTADTSMCIARICLAGSLALEHLTVLWDTVAVALRNGVLSIDGLALSWSPCEVVTANLNVIVGKLAQLVVIHTEELSFLGRTEMETRDLVDDEGEDGANCEGVRSSGNDVGDLLVDGRRSTGNGTSCDAVVDTIETDNVVGGEKTVEEKTNHTGDTVLSEHIEGIVDLDPELDCEFISKSLEEIYSIETYSSWQNCK